MYTEVPQCTQNYLKVRKKTSKVGFSTFLQLTAEIKVLTKKFQNSEWATKSALDIDS